MKLITIDGPSASGKSSIARILAEKLNWPWVSTGVFYRGLALRCLEEEIFDSKELESFFLSEKDFSINAETLFKSNPNVSTHTNSLKLEVLDEKIQKNKWENSLKKETLNRENPNDNTHIGASVKSESLNKKRKEIFSKIKTLMELVNSPCWKVEMKKGETQVFINGQNRTEDIFSEKIALLASGLSQIPEVRQALLKPQRACFIPETGLVAEGRDCGSVVFPQAKVKVYLVADEKIRALRRHKQKEKGTHNHQEESNLKKILEIQTLRDKQDSRRKAAPLKIPKGAFVIDSSLLNENEVVKQILGHSRSHYL